MRAFSNGASRLETYIKALYTVDLALAENAAELLRHALLHQIRHQPLGNQPPAYMLPVNYEPWPEADPASLHPDFPMTHQYATAANLNRGDIAALFGHMNVPSLKHNKMWTMKGDLDAGPDDIAIQHGHVIMPVNPLSMPKDDVQRVIQDPTYQRHLGKAMVVAFLADAVTDAFQLLSPGARSWICQMGFSRSSVVHQSAIHTRTRLA